MSALRYRVTVKLKEKGESVCPSLLCDASFRLKGMGRDNHFVREWGWVRANYTGFYSKVRSRGKERRAYTLSPFCVRVCVCVGGSEWCEKCVRERIGVNVCTNHGAD